MSDDKDGTAGAGEPELGMARKIAHEGILAFGWYCSDPDVRHSDLCNDVSAIVAAAIDALTAKLAAAEREQKLLAEVIVDTQASATRHRAALDTEVRKHAETRAEVERLRAAIIRVRGTCRCETRCGPCRLVAEVGISLPPETPRDGGGDESTYASVDTGFVNGGNAVDSRVRLPAGAPNKCGSDTTAQETCGPCNGTGRYARPSPSTSFGPAATCGYCYGTGKRSVTGEGK